MPAAVLPAPINNAEPARAQLRSTLAANFRGQPVGEGHQTWGGASQLETPQQNKLLVGDPVTLMVSPRPLHAFLLASDTNQKKTGKPQDPQAVHQAPLAGLPRPGPLNRPRPAPLALPDHVPAEPPVVRAPRETLPGPRRVRRLQDHRAPPAPRGLRQVSPRPPPPPGLRARQVPPAL